jgi:arabinan endo-1,5-alpha-L-arabinosidase
MKKIIIIFVAVATITVANTGFLFAQNRTIGAHDPVMIKEGDTYYVMYSGRGVNVLTSKDMKNWTNESPLIKEAPKWISAVIRSSRGSYWAPDISYHNGQYYLYYAI